MTLNQKFSNKNNFRNIYIVESRVSWPAFNENFDPLQDLVLTYDFALRKQIEDLGGAAFYVDNLCDPKLMQENNFLIYDFFRDWHLDANGADLFCYREVGFGFSFRIEIWNDFTFYVRSRLCLEQLRLIVWENIYLDIRLPLLREVIDDMGLTYNLIECDINQTLNFHGYFFPIHRWMNERLRIRLFRHKLRDFVVTVQGFVMSWLDRKHPLTRNKVSVFVQEYHPTRQLLQLLQQQPSIRVMQAHFSSAPGLTKYLKERPIPVYGSFKPYQPAAEEIIENFRKFRSASLILTDGIDITESAYRVIERKVIEVMPESLRALDCVIKYLDRHPLSLEVLIANIGQLAMLVDSVAKSRGVPSYLIINGLLGNAYLDEAKYATVINGYSSSIKDNYFRGMKNVICLGDPRMDAYTNLPTKFINRRQPTITIGTSGFNNIDLNSFLAVEFEFLKEVLSAIDEFRGEVESIRVILKVRPNGYREQYKLFTEEYFPNIVDCIVDKGTMRELLTESDLFISIYSQTLFEASCLGIPVIYHKVEQEIMDPPFDCNSELVTTQNRSDLLKALHDFKNSTERFEAFLDKTVMEKYVGPLDGKNLERNYNFVMELLNKRTKVDLT